MKLTKDQIILGIVHPFLTILAYALSFIDDKEVVEDVLSETAASISLVREKLQTPPTIDDVVHEGLKIADTITDGTETQVDDAVVESIKSVYEAATGKGIGGLFAAIKGWIAIHKAKKAEANG